MKIRGAIFDMDGTLVDSLMYWDHLWESIGKKYMNDASFKPTDEDDKKVRTMIYSEAMTYFWEKYRIPAELSDFLSFVTDGLGDFYRKIVRPKEGAIELLEFLKSKGIRICLATATKMSDVKIAVEVCDIDKYLDFKFSCADIGVGKDRPDIYLISRDALDFSADEICVFEDSFLAIETAKKAGFKTIGIYDQYNAEQERLRASADIYLEKGRPLSDLTEYIEAM